MSELSDTVEQVEQPLLNMSGLLEASVILPDYFEVSLTTAGRGHKMTLAVIRSHGHELAYGLAKRKTNDFPCAPVGEAYAVARALYNLAEKFAALAATLDVGNSLDENDADVLFADAIFKKEDVA